VGVDWKLSKQHSLGAFYRYQVVRDDDDDNEPNIHMLGLSYKFKF
jgi:predicted porin